MYLIEKKSRIIGIFKNKNHINIRTIKFTIHMLEKILKIAFEMDLSNYEAHLVEECYYQLLSYIVYYCIEYKEGTSQEEWAEKTEFSYIGVSLVNEYIAKFKFVDQAVIDGYLDVDKEKEVVNLYVKEKSEKVNSYYDPLKKLEGFWELEDEEIESNIKQIKEKLKRDGYDKQFYPEIVLILLRIVNIGFDRNNLTEIQDIMITNIQKNGFVGEFSEFGLMFRNQEEKEQYKKEIKPIEMYIKEIKDDYKKININYYIKQESGWGEKFSNYRLQNRDKFLTEKRFFNLIDVDNLIENIKKSNTKDISDFRRAIGSTYDFRNIKDFYIIDEENLKLFFDELQQIDETEFNKYGNSKKYNINLLKEQISQILNKLE